MLKQAVALTVIAVVLLGVLLYSQTRKPPLKVSGFVEADEIRVGSRVGGRVKKVQAVEGQSVHAGDLLIELEPFDVQERRAEVAQALAGKKADYDRLSAGYRAEEIAQAQARRDQLAAKLDRLQTGPRKQDIAAAQARVDLAQAQLDLAESTHKRIAGSFEKNAASADEMERATEELKVAKATHEVRMQELDQLQEGTRKEELAEAKAQLAEAESALALMKNGYRAQDIAQAKAAMDAAAATLAAVDRQIEELVVKAPLDGVIEAVELRPGDLVSPNAPVLSILDTQTLWVRTYVPENRMNLQLGQKLPITVDSFPGKQFEGHVSFISRQAEFTPGNVQTPEDRSKQVFRIKVTIDQGRDVLHPGMSADVWLDKK